MYTHWASLPPTWMHRFSSWKITAAGTNNDNYWSEIQTVAECQEVLRFDDFFRRFCPTFSAKTPMISKFDKTKNFISSLQLVMQRDYFLSSLGTDVLIAASPTCECPGKVCRKNTLSISFLRSTPGKVCRKNTLSISFLRSTQYTKITD